MKASGVPRLIKLNTRIIADELTDLGWDIKVCSAEDPAEFMNYTVFDDQASLSHDMVYYLPAGKAGSFPVHKYAFISLEDIAGDAPHICVSGRTEIQVVNALNDMFRKYRIFRDNLNEVLVNDGSLTDLCRVGMDFFGNPLYIHDNMFCILALPQYVAGMREFEVDKTTGKSYIPLWLVNDFKFDEEYQRTLTTHKAEMWGNEQYPRDFRCMYVNIWDGSYYMGRLIIEEMWTPIKPGQMKTAECFALYARAVMLRNLNFEESYVAAFEDAFARMLNGEPVDDSVCSRLMNTMGWQDSDSYICVKTISQDPALAVKSDNSLRSKYAEIIKSFFSFYYDNECCLLVNLTKSGLSSTDLERLLAPFIRESYMYAGMSNSFRDIRYAPQGFKQVDHVLAQMSKDPGKWINSFSRCVLDYMIKGVSKELSLSMIVDPKLLDIIAHDKKNHSLLYETLRTYLENERDISRTAELLSVHRTTIIYRLGRIERFFNLDLDDPDKRLYLLICFKMLDQMDVWK